MGSIGECWGCPFRPTTRRASSRSRGSPRLWPTKYNRSGYRDDRRTRERAHGIHRQPSSSPVQCALRISERFHLAVMENDERNGVDAGKVVEVVHRVLHARNPPRRVSVGKLDERSAPWPSGSCPTASSKEWRGSLASDCPCPISSEAQRCTMDGPPCLRLWPEVPPRSMSAADPSCFSAVSQCDSPRRRRHVTLEHVMHQESHKLTAGSTEVRSACSPPPVQLPWRVPRWAPDPRLRRDLNTITSFDGTAITFYWFPAVGLSDGQKAPPSCRARVSGVRRRATRTHPVARPSPAWVICDALDTTS